MAKSRSNRGRPRGRKAVALKRSARRGGKSAKRELARRRRAAGLAASKSRRGRTRARRNGLALTNGLALENGRRRRKSTKGRRRMSPVAAYAKKHKVSVTEAARAVRGGRKSKAKSRGRKSTASKRAYTKRRKGASKSKRATAGKSFEKFFMSLMATGQNISYEQAYKMWVRAGLCSKIKRPQFLRSMETLLSMGVSPAKALAQWEATDPCNIPGFGLDPAAVKVFRGRAQRPDFMLSPSERLYKRFKAAFKDSGLRKNDLNGMLKMAKRFAKSKYEAEQLVKMLGNESSWMDGLFPKTSTQMDLFGGSGTANWSDSDDLGYKVANNNPFGALALTNGLAAGLAEQSGVTFSIGELASVHGLKQAAIDWKDIVSGSILGGSVTAALEFSGATEKTVELLDMVGGETVIPWIELPVSHVVPFSVQGIAAGLVLGLAAHYVGGDLLNGSVRNVLAAAAGSTMAFGVGLDTKNLISHIWEQNQSASVDITDMSLDPSLAGLALENMGALALQNVSALGDLGDGFAYTLAPLQAQTSDYGQATFADAYYSGVDFSVEEGSALQNGRHAFVNSFGEPPYRPKSQPGTASHLAGQRGHRWGWLIRLVGWERAQAITKMAPAKRVALLHNLRQSAMAAYKKAMIQEHALNAESAAAQPEFSPVTPAAGTVPGAPQGATNGLGSAEYLGDGALFTV